MTRACSLLIGAAVLLAACGSGGAADHGTSGGSAVDLTVVGPDGGVVTFSPPIVSSTVTTSPTAPGPGTPTTRPGATVPGATAAGGTSVGGSTAGTTSTATTIAGGATTSPASTLAPTAVVTTLAATTVPTTAAPTTVADTSPPSTEGAPVCDLALVLAQTETTFEGITPDQLVCSGTWASWSGFPDDPVTTDGYFAVAQWTGIAWQLKNLGTADVCTGGGVPADLWPALGCFE